MKHYTSTGVVKSLAIRLVAQMVEAGKIKASNRRQFRDAVVAAAHTAFMEVQ